MNGPFCLLQMLMAGGFAAGVAIHARKMLRGEQREAHALLALICAISSGFLLIESRLAFTPDVAFYARWRHVATVFTALFMALYPHFVSRATRSSERFSGPFFVAGAALLIVVSVASPSGRPWLPHVDGFKSLVLPWGETVFQPRGERNGWFFVFVPLWLLVGCHGLWRGLRLRRTGEVVGARVLVISNLFFVVAIVNDASVDRGLYLGPYLSVFIPAALTAGIWWQLSLVDRRRVESYRDLFERSGDAILIHDARDGAIVEANESACLLFRRRRAELVGATLDAIVAPEATLPPGEFARRVAELRSSGGAIRERRLRRLDGSEFMAEVALRLATLEGRERLVASFRDLTDRVRVEQALVGNERRLRAIISRSPIAIVEAAEDGRVLSVNPSFADSFGDSVGDLLDERWRARLAQARGGGGIIRSFPASMVDRQGRRRELDICGVLTGDSAVLFVTDLTDVIAARDEIARRDAFYRVLIEAASDGICVLDLGAQGEPTVTVWNRRMAEITGLAAEQAMAPGWVGQLDGGAASGGPMREMLGRLRQGAGALRDHEWTATRRDGEARICLVTTVALPRAIGDGRVVLAARDITALKQAEQERRQADAQVRHAQQLESLGILAGGIAHDFNNILMPILGRAGLMGSRLGLDHPARGQLRDMEQASRRAAELCQQLLAYAGKGRTRSGPFDLGPLASEMARVLATAHAHAARLTTRIDERLPFIVGDQSQIRQVVMNLITNAVEAVGPTGGEVSLCLRHLRLVDPTAVEAGPPLAPGDYIALEVVDAGCGMDEATRRRMFEPFFTTKPTGRGLGMAAVLGVVRGHGGGLQVESTVGRGTSMRVLLPVFHGETAEPTPAVQVPTQLPGGTVLVVDDEDTIRRTTRDMLVHLGFEVILAGSGSEAVAEFARARERIRSVVLDLTMPGIDGGETLRRLRAIDGRVRVVLASGYSRDEVVRELRDADVSAFLQKPYDVAALAAALHAALGAGVGP